MAKPLEINVRDGSLTEIEEAEIRAKAEKLERFYDRIVHVRVAVQGPGRHHRAGRWDVHVDLKVPGSEIVINHQAGETFAETVREAFEAAGRRLEEHVRKARGYVKHHAAAPPPAE